MAARLSFWHSVTFGVHRYREKKKRKGRDGIDEGTWPGKEKGRTRLGFRRCCLDEELRGYLDDYLDEREEAVLSDEP